MYSYDTIIVDMITSLRVRMPKSTSFLYRYCKRHAVVSLMFVALATLGMISMACGQNAQELLESADSTPSSEITPPPQPPNTQPTQTATPTENTPTPTPDTLDTQPTQTATPTDTPTPTPDTLDTQPTQTATPAENTPTPNPDTHNAQPAQTQPDIEFPFNLNELRTYGDMNSPVTIVEFSDFQCPFCRRFQSETLPLIKEKYIEPGTVSIAFIDSPLESFHFEARAAARAAWCADEQGAFWEYHDLLFENQDKFAGDTFDANAAGWANDLNLDATAFGMCYEDTRSNDKVSQGVNISAFLQVRGVPFFLFFKGDEFIGSLRGAQPYEAFEQAIEISLTSTTDQ